MAQFPLLSAKIAFGTNPLDANPVWTDLGPAGGLGSGGHGYVRSVETKRGRERLLRAQAQFQPGTAKVVLDNRGRQFDPTNTAGPFWPNVQPEKLMQVGMTTGGRYYPIWTGFSDDFAQEWPGNSDGICTVPATDLFKAFSLSRMVTTGYIFGVLAAGPSFLIPWSDQPNATTPAQRVTGATPMAPLPLAVGGATIDAVRGLPGPFPADPAQHATRLPTQIYTLPASCPTPSGGSWVYEEWLQAPTPPATGYAFTVFGAPDGSYLQGTLGGGAMTLQCRNPAGTTTSVVVAAGVFNDYNWHHIAIEVVANQAHAIVDGNPFVAPVTICPAGTIPVTANGASVSVGYGNHNRALTAFYGYQVGPNTLANNCANGLWPADPTGSRLNRALNAANIPSTLRRIATGRSVCQASFVDETQTKILQYVQKIEQTEQGQCFVGADGAINFTDRYNRYNAAGLIPAATFGDAATDGPNVCPAPAPSWALGAGGPAGSTMTLVGSQFVYSGAATSSGNSYAYSTTIPVTPGQQYRLSAFVDATNVTPGANLPGVGVYPLGFATTYGQTTQAAGKAGVITVTFTVPAGATQAVVLLDTFSAALGAAGTVTFGPPTMGLTELPYRQGGVTLNFDRVELFNEIPVTRRNGLAQIAIDQPSVDAYTERTMPGLSDLLYTADADSFGCGHWILAETAHPHYRVGDLVVDCTADPRIWPVILAAEIGTVWRVNKNRVPGGGPPISIDCRIEGIEHQIAAPNKWVVTLHLSLAHGARWLAFDDTEHGTFDSGAAWGW